MILSNAHRQRVSGLIFDLFALWPPTPPTWQIEFMANKSVLAQKLKGLQPEAAAVF